MPLVLWMLMLLLGGTLVAHYYYTTRILRLRIDRLETLLALQARSQQNGKTLALKRAVQLSHLTDDVAALQCLVQDHDIALALGALQRALQ